MGVDFEKCDECGQCYPDCGDNYPRGIVIDGESILICPHCLSNLDGVYPEISHDNLTLHFKSVFSDGTVEYYIDHNANIETWNVISDRVYGTEVEDTTIITSISCFAQFEQEEDEEEEAEEEEEEEESTDGKEEKQEATMDKENDKEDEEPEEPSRKRSKKDDVDNKKESKISKEELDWNEAFNKIDPKYRISATKATSFVKHAYPTLMQSLNDRWEEKSEDHCKYYCRRPKTPQQKEEEIRKECKTLRSKLDSCYQQISRLENHSSLVAAASILTQEQHGFPLAVLLLVIDYTMLMGPGVADRLLLSDLRAAASTTTTSRKRTRVDDLET